MIRKVLVYTIEPPDPGSLWRKVWRAEVAGDSAIWEAACTRGEVEEAMRVTFRTLGWNPDEISFDFIGVCNPSLSREQINRAQAV